MTRNDHERDAGVRTQVLSPEPRTGVMQENPMTPFALVSGWQTQIIGGSHGQHGYAAWIAGSADLWGHWDCPGCRYPPR